MKKIITLSLFIVLFYSASAQILTRNENWPNASWSVGGVYTPAALIFNPSLDTEFKYNAALANPVGSPTTLFAASPIFSIKPAFDGGETNLKINFNISYAATAESVLMVQYWDANTSLWVTMPDGSAPIGSIGSIDSCTNLPVSLYFNFSNLTANQLENFRYRFSLNDTGNLLSGVCINSPVISSLSCLPPTNLTVSNISPMNASLDWTSNGTNFEVEYGVHGFSIGSGNHQQVNSHPYWIGGLNPATNYDFYVREDCSQNQIVISSWAGPKSFTTATLGIDEHTLKGFQLYPNPTKNIVWMDSEKIINDIKILNLFGQELINTTPSKSHTNIDLSNLNTGIYFLKVTTEDGFGIYKIIKN